MTSIGNKETFAKNLTYYIERTGRTQKELADMVGVACSTFNDWVRGRKYPRIDKIEILANYFGIQKSDLIEDKEKPTDANDGLSKDILNLIEEIKKLPEDKVQMLLQVAKSIR